MPDIVARLKEGMQGGTADSKLLEDVLKEIVELRERRDTLEEILILLARTTLPWDEDGNPGENFPAFRERYQRTMHEASELLGLDHRSMLTRTEPRT